MSIRYTNEHEWVRLEGDVGTIGITSYAQEKLGDVVFVEVPAAGRKVAKGESVAVVESVKAASDIYAPVTGEVVEANALARRALGDLPLDDRSAKEAALRAAFLADAPEQPRLDRRRAGVDVVTVEAEARLEAQRIARPQSDRLHFGLRQQLARDRVGGVGRRRDLVAVTASVTRARDVAFDTVDHDVGPGHELHDRNRRRQSRQRLGRLRALQRQQPTRKHRLDFTASR